MKFTKQGDVCQNCGAAPATTRITWDEEDHTLMAPPEPSRWSEDWCEACTKNATDYVELTALVRPIV